LTTTANIKHAYYFVNLDKNHLMGPECPREWREEKKVPLMISLIEGPRTVKTIARPNLATDQQLDEAEAAAENTVQDLFSKFRNYKLALKEVVEREAIDFASKIKASKLKQILTTVFGSELKMEEVRRLITILFHNIYLIKSIFMMNAPLTRCNYSLIGA
jgi:hypothetical protein